MNIWFLTCSLTASAHKKKNEDAFLARVPSLEPYQCGITGIVKYRNVE
ncbi:MAG: hypothetical protein GY855_08225 [candidate division Zixibacteria bacterium]|nr:hypothetical protein [candidate division Zixibacteria bacterium]